MRNATLLPVQRSRILLVPLSVFHVRHGVSGINVAVVFAAEDSGADGHDHVGGDHAGTGPFRRMHVDPDSFLLLRVDHVALDHIHARAAVPDPGAEPHDLRVAPINRNCGRSRIGAVVR